MLKSECHWDPSTASFHRQEPFDAPQRLPFSVGNDLRLLNLFLPPSAPFWCPSISSFHRRQRPEAPQFLLFVVGNPLMLLTRIHNRKITHFSVDTIIKTENLHKIITFYVILAFEWVLLEEFCVILQRVLTKAHDIVGKKVAFAIYSTFKNVGVWEWTIELNR